MTETVDLENHPDQTRPPSRPRPITRPQPNDPRPKPRPTREHTSGDISADTHRRAGKAAVAARTSATCAQATGETGTRAAADPVRTAPRPVASAPIAA